MSQKLPEGLSIHSVKCLLVVNKVNVERCVPPKTIEYPKLVTRIVLKYRIPCQCWALAWPFVVIKRKVCSD